MFNMSIIVRVLICQSYHMNYLCVCIYCLFFPWFSCLFICLSSFHLYIKHCIWKKKYIGWSFLQSRFILSAVRQIVWGAKKKKNTELNWIRWLRCILHFLYDSKHLWFKCLRLSPAECLFQASPLEGLFCISNEILLCFSSPTLILIL